MEVKKQMEMRSSAYDYTNKIIVAFKKNWKIILFLVLFAIGMIIGAILIKKDNSEIINSFLNIFKTYIRIKKEQSIGSNFINSLAINLIFVLCAFILGLCAVGLPFISMLPVIKGVGIGMLTGFLYSNFALRGLGYCILVLYPGLMPAVYTLLLSCNIGVNTSYNMLLTLSSNKIIKGETNLKIYCLKFLIFFVLIIFSSVIDAMAISLFSGFFSF